MRLAILAIVLFSFADFSSAQAVRRHIGAGTGHSCAIRAADNTTWCWGRDGHGELGVANIVHTITPQQVPLAGFQAVEVTAGIFHTCVLGADANVWCWGAFGSGVQNQGVLPVQIANDANGNPFSASALAVGVAMHSCAQKPDGTLWCWGYNTDHELGDGTIDFRSAPVPVLGLTGAGVLQNVTSVTTGQTHTCAVMNDGTGHVVCWGNNDYGQLGDGTLTGRPYPHLVLSAPGVLLSNVRQVGAGGRATCALKADTTVWCWGDLAVNFGARVFPQQLFDQNKLPFNNVTAISVGGFHSCALRADGTTWCWGSNVKGELGDGTMNDSLFTPVRALVTGPGGDFPLAEIYAGSSHTCGFASMFYWCWGWNSDGEIGAGVLGKDQATPLMVNMP